MNAQYQHMQATLTVRSTNSTKQERTQIFGLLDRLGI